MDPRLTPANTRVAAQNLRGKVQAQHFVKPMARQVITPIADLLSAPHGRRERQLLMGDEVMLYESREGWSFVQSSKDGYVGYLPGTRLEEHRAPTHWVTAPATHLYCAPDLKSRERVLLYFASRMQVVEDCGAFVETPEGFLPKVHIAPLAWHFGDPVAVAQQFLGTPYLWGGNSRKGIDCSGLVQISCLACGMDCPADSDMQQAGLGHELAEDEPLRRGDLIFWKGHVGIMVDGEIILHANGHSMSVIEEPLKAVIRRIEALENGGPVLARKRLPQAPRRKEQARSKTP